MPREPGWVRRFDDDLVGLDRDDPEARAFAQHLERMESSRPGFTVEGYLDGVRDFADSANRAQGFRYWAAVVVVVLLLVGVGWVMSRAVVSIVGLWS